MLKYLVLLILISQIMCCSTPEEIELKKIKLEAKEQVRALQVAQMGMHTVLTEIVHSWPRIRDFSKTKSCPSPFLEKARYSSEWLRSAEGSFSAKVEIMEPDSILVVKVYGSFRKSKRSILGTFKPTFDQEIIKLNRLSWEIF